MIAECGCHPGTSENGWHETRSEECRQVEREDWARACRIAREIARKAAES